MNHSETQQAACIFNKQIISLGPLGNYQVLNLTPSPAFITDKTETTSIDLKDKISELKSIKIYAIFNECDPNIL